MKLAWCFFAQRPNVRPYMFAKCWHNVAHVIFWYWPTYVTSDWSIVGQIHSNHEISRIQKRTGFKNDPLLYFILHCKLFENNPVFEISQSWQYFLGENLFGVSCNLISVLISWRLRFQLKNTLQFRWYDFSHCQATALSNTIQLFRIMC